MKLTALVENTSSCELKARHGLALYIESDMHKILFDLGPDNTLFENAARRGIDLSKVDTAIISHGHMDHGGALEKFLAINDRAKVYVQETAFQPHYTKVLGIRFNCGIDAKFMRHPQVVLLHGEHRIDAELHLFTVKDMRRCYSCMNDCLYCGREKDDFRHEQHLIIRDRRAALIMGCGHAGVVNIMEAAKAYKPAVCVGGYHLMNPNSFRTVPDALLDGIAEALNAYPDTRFYTCHCTGMRAYKYLSAKVPTLKYISCGASVEC